MSGWYGHTINVEIENDMKFPKYGGKLSFLDSIIADESEKINSKIKFLGSELAHELALKSQIYQKRAITELGAVRTGRLRDSIKITGSGLSSSIGTDLFYAETVHDIGYRNQKIFNINGLIIRGHSDIGPRPWTDYAADRLTGEISQIVSGKLAQLI